MDIAALAKGAIERGAIQKFAELSPFLHLIAKKKPKTVVEIGTDRGGTFWALCRVAHPKATIVSIDLPGGPFSSGNPNLAEAIFQGYGLPGQKLHFFRLDSHKDSTKDKLQAVVEQIDLLLIDGDHTYAGAKKDWEMYSPMVKKGGLIAFHDICYHPKVPACQVELVWKEVKGRYFDIVEFIDEKAKDWGGIGVLTFKEKPPEKFDANKGLLIDLNPIPVKQVGFMGMAGRQHPNVDIVHDLESFPWPFEDNACHIVIGTYIIQKIQPRLMIPFMNELWRIIRPQGQLALSMPYANSPGFYADPLNINQINEMTFFYFDPNFPAYIHYEPKPWEIQKGSPQWVAGGNLEVAMRPRK